MNKDTEKNTMEQQDCLVDNVALEEVARTESASDCFDALPERWQLALPVRVVDLLSSYTIGGVLQSFTPGEVSILVDEPLSEQRSVTVHLNSFAFDGQTLYCRPRQDRFEAHISIDDVGANGLRRAPRFPVKLPAELFLPDLDPVGITIVDISSDGLGLELPVSVETDQPIAVECGSVFIFGVARHCRPTAAGIFRAGAEMHHLFERDVELPKDSPRATFLQKLLGVRTRKEAELICGARSVPRLL
jgi:hypothetical protein